jgi:hypothetical protein
MPTFENVEIEVETRETNVSIKTNIEFEVYCDTCGTGICGNSRTVISRNRGALQVRVEVCDTCMQAKADEILYMEEQKTELDQKISDLEEENQGLKETISELMSKIKKIL